MIGRRQKGSVRRRAAVVAMAIISYGCASSSTPSGEDTPTASSAVQTPGSSGSPSTSAPPTPLASASPAGSPSLPTDAFEDIPAAEGALNAIWIADGTVVAGGFTGPVFGSAIVVFEDGAWSAADVPDAPGQVTGIVKIGDRWIAVGNGLPDIRSGFIWDSADGRVWREVQTIEDAALYDVVAGDGVVVAVGARLDAEMNSTATAWSSTDGTTWERARVAAAAGKAMGSVATTPDGFAATGDRPLGEARPFWTAATATSWEAVENDLNDQLLPIDLVHRGDGLVLVGASGKSGDQHPFVALSADGQDWERTNLSEEEGYASAVTVAGDRLVVAGVDADRLTLWSLRDGDWTAETFEESGASISALAWDDQWGLLAIGTRDGLHAVWLIDS